VQPLKLSSHVSLPQIAAKYRVITNDVITKKLNDKKVTSAQKLNVRPL
jgi:hypothetical protein